MGRGVWRCWLHLTTPATNSCAQSWAEPGEGGSGSAVGRARLDLQAEQPSLRAYRSSGGSNPRWTGIIISVNALPSPDGRHLFITSGERFKFTVAQDLNQNLGKVIRLTPEGAPPTTLLLAARSRRVGPTATATLASMVQAAAEMGPRGGDEFNRVSGAPTRLAERFEWTERHDSSPIPRPVQSTRGWSRSFHRPAS